MEFNLENHLANFLFNQVPLNSEFFQALNANKEDIEVITIDDDDDELDCSEGIIFQLNIDLLWLTWPISLKLIFSMKWSRLQRWAADGCWSWFHVDIQRGIGEDLEWARFDDESL